ncbi:MAG: tRNA (guanosine(46)-N7)-methyltransferase TrmB [Campylobacterota bacterium]|nr:tRNA (guanosine(46)-N7)-methyltransferase TrmB [Campylobacterota bacterium]
MPHLHVKEFHHLTFPLKEDGSEFKFLAQNCDNENEKLICVNSDNKDFFLQIKESNDKKLLKVDKTTRPTQLSITKKALLNFATCSNLEVISSNVDNCEVNMHLKDDTSLKSINYFIDDFPSCEKISIEVGFGSGRHLLHQAINNKDMLFVGIEIHKVSIQQVLKQIVIHNLTNLLILDYDARLFMELVPSNIVSKIFVHFPVPWDKKPHRRVISKSFIDEANRILKVGGSLELRTDSENYYAYSFETFNLLNKMSLHINKNRDIEVVSKYETRWRKMEKNIYDLTMTCEEHSTNIVINGDFEFENVKFDINDLDNYRKKTLRFENGFVHFERLYSINSEFNFFRISIGSFDRPENLYLFINSGKLSYFPKSPIKTRTNLEIHNKLKEYING